MFKICHIYLKLLSDLHNSLGIFLKSARGAVLMSESLPLKIFQNFSCWFPQRNLNILSCILSRGTAPCVNVWEIFLLWWMHLAQTISCCVLHMWNVNSRNSDTIFRTKQQNLLALQSTYFSFSMSFVCMDSINRINVLIYQILNVSHGGAEGCGCWAFWQNNITVIANTFSNSRARRQFPDREQSL